MARYPRLKGTHTTGDSGKGTLTASPSSFSLSTALLTLFLADLTAGLSSEAIPLLSDSESDSLRRPLFSLWRPLAVSALHYVLRLDN